MLIDWFTVGAQIVNFIILIYLLKRFLYKPILRAMDEREQKIATRLQQAEATRKKADADAAALARERRELENKKEKLQAEAREEIEAWRDQAMEKAKAEVEKARNAWQDTLDRDKEDFIRRVKTTLSRQVFKAAAKVVRDLADEQLEAKMVARFNRLLPKALEAEKKKQIMGDHLRVVTGFALKEDQQKELRRAVAESCPAAKIEFRVEREAGYTIRLSGNNRRIEWGLRQYMEEMEEHIFSVMHLDRERNR